MCFHLKLSALLLTVNIVVLPSVRLFILSDSQIIKHGGHELWVRGVVYKSSLRLSSALTLSYSTAGGI